MKFEMEYKQIDQVHNADNTMIEIGVTNMNDLEKLLEKYEIPFCMQEDIVEVEKEENKMEIINEVDIETIKMRYVNV